jgi:hypothetical protein
MEKISIVHFKNGTRILNRFPAFIRARLRPIRILYDKEMEKLRRDSSTRKTQSPDRLVTRDR